MKVLNVNHLLDPVMGGGTAERTFQMSLALAEAGIDCFVVTTNIGLVQDRVKQLENIHLTILPCVYNRYAIPIYNFKKLTTFVQQADIVHLMGHWTLVNVLVYLLVRRMKKPYVYCPAGALPIYGRSKRLKRVYNFILGKRIVTDAARCIAITNDEKQDFRNYGVNDQKIVVIPNGISKRDFIAKDDTGFRKRHNLSEKPIILFMGRLNQIKGPDLLLHAFCQSLNEIPECQLVFVGPDDGMLPVLRGIAKEYNIKKQIHFIGYLGGEEKSHAYNAADLLVIPSRREAMSIVVLEAGMTKTPVLLTDQCGFNEVERVGGGKVVTATVAGLRDGLTELLQDFTHLTTMGEKLKVFVARDYTWDAIIRKFLTLYRDILSD